MWLRQHESAFHIRKRLMEIVKQRFKGSDIQLSSHRVSGRHRHYLTNDKSLNIRWHSVHQSTLTNVMPKLLASHHLNMISKFSKTFTKNYTYSVSQCQVRHQCDGQAHHLRWISKDYFSRRSDLRRRENLFLGLTSASKPVFHAGIGRNAD